MRDHIVTAVQGGGVYAGDVARPYHVFDDGHEVVDFEVRQLAAQSLVSEHAATDTRAAAHILQRVVDDVRGKVRDEAYRSRHALAGPIHVEIVVRATGRAVDERAGLTRRQLDYVHAQGSRLVRVLKERTRW